MIQWRRKERESLYEKPARERVGAKEQNKGRAPKPALPFCPEK